MSQCIYLCIMVIVYILELRPNAFLKYCVGKNGMDGWTDNPKNIMALITAGAARIWQSEANPSLPLVSSGSTRTPRRVWQWVDCRLSC